MRYRAGLLLWLLTAPALLAHNFWIETSTFTPLPGQRLSVRLRVGQELQGDPVPRDPSLMKRFVAVGPSGETPVPGCRTPSRPASRLSRCRGCTRSSTTAPAFR